MQSFVNLVYHTIAISRLRDCAMQTSSTRTIFLSYETLRAPRGVDEFIPAHNLESSKLQQSIRHASEPSKAATQQRSLLIIDTLHPLLSDPSVTNPASFLSSLITPKTHLLAIYHSPQPLPPRPQSSPATYAPGPLTLLQYLATTIFTVHNLHHILAAKAARDRSRAAPLHGLEEAEEGTLQGLGANDARGIVVEAEMRRRSGRTVALWFVIDALHRQNSSAKAKDQGSFPGITLLEEHPLYRVTPQPEPTRAGNTQDESEHGEVSFNLGLTEKQRRDREGVVLPYHDAQSGEGIGEGGRILYDMGSEDDFDDEEDEI